MGHNAGYTSNWSVGEASVSDYSGKSVREVLSQGLDTYHAVEARMGFLGGIDGIQSETTSGCTQIILEDFILEEEIL